MRRVKSAGSFKTVKPRRRFFPATAIKTSCRALAMSMATQTGASCAITISVTVGLLCGVVCCKSHCRDLRRGDDHLLRYLGAAQAVIASQPASFRKCYGIQFCEQPRRRNTPYSRPMRVDKICTENGIGHRLTQPAYPWARGQVDRMNRTIKARAVRRHHYKSHIQPQTHLSDFVDTDN